MLCAHNTKNDKTYSILTDVRNSYKILAEKLKIKRPFGGPRLRYDDIKIHISGIVCEIVK
jgi:hypothetical protein